jgi:hypothetical protein
MPRFGIYLELHAAGGDLRAAGRHEEASRPQRLVADRRRPNPAAALHTS